MYIVNCRANPALSVKNKNVNGIGRASLSKTDLELICQF